MKLGKLGHFAWVGVWRTIGAQAYWGRDDNVSDGWRSRFKSWGPLVAMLAGVAAWLWPLGVGGRMPVGGDVTQFSIGLMGFLSDSLKAGRLPIWNDRWGFGFPGLAESQMGVYYPPHLMLYGPFFTELAYTLSLVFHTFLCALGAYWAARQWGVSRIGAALTGFCFTTCGFFVIHLPHQWGYTVAAWLPWAWGLAWNLMNGRGGRRTALLLAAVVAVQTLPGHFQIAFITQAMVGLMALVGLLRASSRRGALLVMLGLVAVLPLDACQLWPTWQLAQQASGQRDFEYLSGFAASPLHLVSYVAPRLFHDSPLWRPLAWDPFHTSPEEHLGYIGLVPLWLAIIAMGWGRKTPGVGLLCGLVAASLLLSLGPYLPLFRLYYEWPGFSFFRAPARWGVATMFALAVLAGQGFDLLVRQAQEQQRLRTRSMLGLAAVGTLWCALPIALIELHELGRQERLLSERIFEYVLKTLPWDSGVLGNAAEESRRSFAALRSDVSNPIVQQGLMRQGRDPDSLFMKERLSIYGAELGPSAMLMAALLALGFLKRKPQVVLPGLLLLTAVDLLSLKSLRAVEDGPIRPLVDQSPVLKLLADQHRQTGARSRDEFGNMAMVGGGSPVVAYRTLDLPARPAVELSLRHRYFQFQGLRKDPYEESLRNQCDIGIWVESLDGWSKKHVQELPPESFEILDDPALTTWLYGRKAVEGARPLSSQYIAYRTPEAQGRAHLALSGEGELILVTRLPYHLRIPEEVEVTAQVPEKVEPLQGVVISNLWDPEWSATWVSADGTRIPAEVDSVFDPSKRGGWQFVRMLPEPGLWTLHLWYEGRAVRLGQWISLFAWAIWLLLWFFPGRRIARESMLVRSSESERIGS